MQRLKATVMLAMALFLLLGWTLALTTASTPMVAHYGVPGCLFFAGLIACVSAWLITGFVAETKEL